MAVSLEEPRIKAADPLASAAEPPWWEKLLLVSILCLAAILMLAWLTFLGWMASWVLFALWS